MKLEDQVCSLELAKRLKELGVRQESEYEWEADKGPTKQKPSLKTSGVRGCARCGAIINGLPRPTMYAERFAAFTIAELEVLLPLGVNVPVAGGKPRKYDHWRSLKHYGVSNMPYEVVYYGAKSAKILESGRADTFADALAKMLVYLIENHLITV